MSFKAWSICKQEKRLVEIIKRHKMKHKRMSEMTKSWEHFFFCWGVSEVFSLFNHRKFHSESLENYSIFVVGYSLASKSHRRENDNYQTPLSVV